MRRARLVSLLVAAAAGGAYLAGGAAAGGAPAVAVSRAASLDVLDASGALVERFAGSASFSLGARLLARAGGAADRIVVLDAPSGDVRFRIPRAWGPVVLSGGRVLFLPDRSGKRDPQVNSVWLRARRGTIRRVIQFSNGPGLPGIRTGFDAATILGVSSDAAGRTLAVVEGNDVDLFRYDVWIVDVPSRQAFRATHDGRSRFATVDPAGARIAYLRETASCGGPPPGFGAGDLVLRPTARGGQAEVLVAGSCAAFLAEPRWLSSSSLVAVRLTRTAPGVYANELVQVDAASGAVGPLAGGAGAFALSASPTLGLVGFMRLTGGSALLDPADPPPLELADAVAPKVARDGAWP